MSYLKENHAILTMDEVVDCHLSGRAWPKGAVAVTFDDGFANNYSLAATVLDDLRVPATFYVCSGMIDTKRMFWVDELEDCFNRTVQTEVGLTLDGTHRLFRLSSASDRIEALEAVKGHCKRVSDEAVAHILAQVRRTTRVNPSTDAWPGYRVMTWQELREIARNPLFIVGGHSLYHSILAMQTPERTKLDIQTSINLLAYNLRRDIRHYSYPEGQPHHYNDAIIEELKTNSVLCCPSAVVGMNPPQTDLFHLKRIMVGFYGTPLPFRDPLLS